MSDAEQQQVLTLHCRHQLVKAMDQWEVAKQA